MTLTTLTPDQLAFLDAVDPNPAPVSELLDAWPHAAPARAADALRTTLSSALAETARRTGMHVQHAGLPEGVPLDAADRGGELLFQVLRDVAAIGLAQVGRSHRDDAATLVTLLGRLVEAERVVRAAEAASLREAATVVASVNRRHGTCSTRWVLHPRPNTTQSLASPWWSPAEHRQGYLSDGRAVWIDLEIRTLAGDAVPELLGLAGRVVLVGERDLMWAGSMVPGPTSLMSLLITLTERAHVAIAEHAPWVELTPHELDDDVEEDRRHG